MMNILRVISMTLVGIENWIDFNPMKHPQILPNLYVLDIVPGDTLNACRLKIRLTGTRVDSLFNTPATDRFLDELVQDTRGVEAFRKFQECANAGTAVWMKQVACFPDRPARYVESVAIRIQPSRIYGGVVSGEYTDCTGSSFEWLPLEEALRRQGPGI